MKEGGLQGDTAKELTWSSSEGGCFGGAINVKTRWISTGYQLYNAFKVLFDS